MIRDSHWLMTLTLWLCVFVCECVCMCVHELSVYLDAYVCIVYVYIYFICMVDVCVCVHVCKSVWRSVLDSKCILHHILLVKTVSLTEQGAYRLYRQLPSILQRSVCLWSSQSA